MSNDNVVLDEETEKIIFSLRERGLSYTAIAMRLRKQGIRLRLPEVRRACKYIYNRMGKKEPEKEKTETLIQRIIESYGEKIIEKRKKGKSYQLIANEIKEEGESGITAEIISIVCKELFKKIGEKEPKAKARSGKITVSQSIIALHGKEIIKERKKGESYESIAYKYRRDGEKVSSITIRKVCKELFEKIGEEEPETKTLRNSVMELYGDEIVQKRKLGFPYRRIVEDLKKKGVKKVSEGTIRNIYNQLVSCSNKNNSELGELERSLCSATSKKNDTVRLLEQYRGLDSTLGEQKLGEQK